MSAPRRAGLFLLAFGSGFAVLTIEIAGARLIAPVFGLSAVPWTAVIGVILAAVAVGSHLGGRLADAGRVPLSAVLTGAAFTAVLPIALGGFPWIARQVLGFIPGAVVSALVLFAPSVLFLGAVVPYLIRADTGALEEVGRRAGDVSAAATAGSIAGSFVTGFVLLPLLPLPYLMAATAVLLLMLAVLAGRLLGGGVETRAVLLGVVVAGGLAAASTRLPPDTLYRGQTWYADVAVTERLWRSEGRRVRELWQNGGSSSAEYTDTGAPAHSYARASLALLGAGTSMEETSGPDGDAAPLRRIRRALVLGGAALTLPVALVRAEPAMEVDVVEIDPVVTELARRYFAYGQAAYPQIRVVHDDARVFLRGTEAWYDLVYLDVFDHLLTVPWTMVTVEAFASMAEHLGPGGLFMANVLSPLEGPGTAFLARLRATLDEVFGEVRFYRADPEVEPRVAQNVIVVAQPQPGGGVISGLPARPDFPEVEVMAAGPPLRDDFAPVEALQARVFLAGLGWK